MKTTDPVDAARIELLLTELRLPAVKAMWAKFAALVGQHETVASLLARQRRATFAH